MVSYFQDGGLIVAAGGCHRTVGGYAAVSARSGWRAAG